MRAETELPVLVELDTIIATVYDNENPSKPVLESKVAEIKKLVDSLKPSFQLLKSKDAKGFPFYFHIAKRP